MKARIKWVEQVSFLGELIAETLDGLAKNGESGNGAVEESVKTRVHALTKRFPIYS